MPSLRAIARTLLLLTAISPGYAQQNKALELSRDKSIDMQQGMRENLATIGRYAETVQRQVGQIMPESTGTHPPTAVPHGGLPPSIRRHESLVDPFEVSPQLREGRRPTVFSGQVSASKLEIQRQIQIKALLSLNKKRGAHLSIRGQQSVLVKDGDIIDFGELGVFAVNVSSDDGVTLSVPGAPNGNKITLR